jgi:excisionase family DNA binding protein
VVTNLLGGSTAVNRIQSTRKEEFLDYPGAAAFIDVSVGTLQVWICTGRYAIPFYKVGRKVRFKKSELEAWLASRKRGGE